MIPPLVDSSDLPEGLSQGAIDAACAAIRAYCGWHIAPSVTEDVIVDGSGGAVQLLPTLHLTELASISNDGSDVADPEWSQMGAIRGPYCWTRRFRGVEASITHGYDDCPVEIVGVVASLASSDLSGLPRNAQAGPFSLTTSASQQAGASALSPEHRAVLDRYRIPSRP